jgi:hypothetical protein
MDGAMARVTRCAKSQLSSGDESDAHERLIGLAQRPCAWQQ